MKERMTSLHSEQLRQRLQDVALTAEQELNDDLIKGRKERRT